MHFDLAIPAQLSGALTPDLILMGGAMLLLLFAAWRRESAEHQTAVGYGALFLILLTAAVIIWMMSRGATATAGPIAVDNFRWASDLLFLLAAFAGIALAIDYNRRIGIAAGESHVLILLATSGMMLLGAARDLIIVFLGIELMSISVYVLAALDRRDARGAEAGLKYFLLGAFSTGFLLYGIALIYGGTGSMNIAEIGQRLALPGSTTSPMLKVGIALLLVGFSFKVAAVPFHMWTPDVYEGAPTPFTAFMAAAVKAGAFAAFLRVWIEAFSAANVFWHPAVWWLALVTMFVGNIIALRQKNIKRMLAYSSIAHAGYLLVAVVAGTTLGASAFIFYLIAYTLATMGAFGVVIALNRVGSPDLIEDYSGLWNVRPGMAIAMAVFMLALLGFPIAGGMGFFAKWYIIQAALGVPGSPQSRLAVAVVLASVISAGYYMYVVMVMFMKPRPAGAPDPAPTPALTRWVIYGTAVVLLVFGVAPQVLVIFSDRSVPSGTHAPPSGSPVTAARAR